MGDWLVGNFMIFGVQAQNWMLIALAIIFGLDCPFLAVTAVGAPATW
jgi:hypothetical protein